MLDRVVVGEVPTKHHIALRDADGNLRIEECITRRGFDGPYTILYHQHRPQTHRPGGTTYGFPKPELVVDRPLRKCHYRSQDLSPTASGAIDGRIVLLANEDVAIGITRPSDADSAYFVNGDGDDLYFIFRGGGVLRSALGDLRFEELDYVCVPKGIAHRFLPDPGKEQYWLCFEGRGGIGLLAKWRNETGQLRMDAPYSHRDFRRPEFVGPQDEGIREIAVKRQGRFHTFEYDHSPLDVVGWDGTVYPWCFPILNFQPRAGLVHLPPDWHGTFSTRNGLICSFVPRVVDFHPDAIPCPYPHASVDCDEFIFYTRGNFTSRRGVGPGSISHHPMGIPHGPHPGAYERSIGTTRTDELAVMLDTFNALHPTRAALDIEDEHYHVSFLE